MLLKISVSIAIIRRIIQNFCDTLDEPQILLLSFKSSIPIYILEKRIPEKSHSKTVSFSNLGALKQAPVD